MFVELTHEQFRDVFQKFFYQFCGNGLAASLHSPQGNSFPATASPYPAFSSNVSAIFLGLCFRGAGVCT